MYFRQTNKSALRSQNLIADAFLRLLSDKPLQQISITEICTEAAVGRKTFYRNFEFKEDVIDFYIDKLCMQFEAELAGIYGKELLYRYFSFFGGNVEFFSAMYRNGILPVCQAKFAKFIPVTMPVWSDNPVEQEYFSRYVSAGTEAILRCWIERYFAEDIETLVHLALKIQEKQTETLRNTAV